MGTPGQPGAPLPGLDLLETHSSSHRPRSEPGESQGSVLREDSPPQGTLRFSGETRPLKLSAAGGEWGRDGAGATGCRGLRLRDGGQSGEEQARPHPILPPEAPGIAPSPG